MKHKRLRRLACADSNESISAKKLEKIIETRIRFTRKESYNRQLLIDKLEEENKRLERARLMYK